MGPRRVDWADRFTRGVGPREHKSDAAQSQQPQKLKGQRVPQRCRFHVLKTAASERPSQGLIPRAFVSYGRRHLALDIGFGRHIASSRCQQDSGQTNHVEVEPIVPIGLSANCRCQKSRHW
jgi:hypothetical protein